MDCLDNVPHVGLVRIINLKNIRMTPEQILEKHLLIMLGRTEESYISIEEIKKQPEWQTTINAMLEYAEHKALSQTSVISSVKLRNEITKTLYRNSTDDSECIRIRFEDIQNIIDLLIDLYD